MPAKKELTLDNLLNDGKKVYVKNTSHPMGNIILTFISTNGKAIPRPIPRTWIPVCLTDTVSPDVIRQSNELRQFMNKGILQLIDPDEALDELKGEDAIEEMARLNVSEFSQSHVPTQRTETLAATQTYETSLNNAMDPPSGMHPDPVNARVTATLLRVESKDITEREAAADFRVMQKELTNHDLTYIISSVEGEGPLRRFALQLLNAQSAAVDPDMVKEPVAETNEDPAEDPAAVAAARAHQATNA